MYGVTLVLLALTVILDGKPYIYANEPYRCSCDRSIQTKVLIISQVYKRCRYFRHTPTQGAVPRSVLLRVIMFTIYRIVVVMYVRSAMISCFQHVNQHVIHPSSTYGAILKRPPEQDVEHIFLSDSHTMGMIAIPLWVDMLQAARMSIITVTSSC
jgi:hypothetical protein